MCETESKIKRLNELAVMKFNRNYITASFEWITFLSCPFFIFPHSNVIKFDGQ